MIANRGGCPGITAGRRVHVRLRNGYSTHEAEPNGWAASTSRWNLIGSPFDILEWELVQ